MTQLSTSGTRLSSQKHDPVADRLSDVARQLALFPSRVVARGGTQWLTRSSMSPHSSGLPAGLRPTDHHLTFTECQELLILLRCSLVTAILISHAYISLDVAVISL
jgi:hypothetical protein